MKRVKHLIEYALVRLLEAALFLPPRSVALRLGERLGSLASRLIPKRNRLIIDNLSRAFPETSAEEIRRIAAGVWRNLGRTAVEFVRMSEVQRAPDGLTTIEVDPALAEEIRRGGRVLVTAHFTNWELSGILVSRFFGGITGIARPMRNPYVDAWIRARRSAGGLQMILHREAVKASLRCVRGGRNIGILVDHNLYTGGVFVRFFGRLAASTTLPALLHARTGAPVIHLYTVRDGERFRLFGERVDLPKIEDEARAIVDHTQRIAAALEAVIRRYPENWFWIHNRWKRAPGPGDVVADPIA